MRIKWVVGMVIILSCIMPMIGVAEQTTKSPTVPMYASSSAKLTKMAIYLKSDEELPLPEGETPRRVMIKGKYRDEYGYLKRLKGKRVWETPNKTLIELPDFFEFRISRDGGMILGVGEGKIHYPAPFLSFYWLNSQGEVVNTLFRKFDGEAIFSLSDDGFTCLAGRLFRKPLEKRLALYSPKGEMIWEVPLEKKERIQQILLTPNGKWICLLVTDGEYWRKDHRIKIWNQNGELIASFLDWENNIKIYQMHDDHFIFVRTPDRFGVVDVQTGRLLWERREDIRIVSFYGVALSPDDKTMFLITRNVEEKGEGGFHWVLRSLDGFTGDELMAKQPLGKIQSAPEDNGFERVTPTEVSLLAGNHRMIFSWKREGGDQ